MGKWEVVGGLMALIKPSEFMLNLLSMQPAYGVEMGNMLSEEFLIHVVV